MRSKPVPWEVYRHYKGNLYQVIAVATHTETDEEMVVYQALYGDFRIYCRPLSMFMSEVGDEGSGEYRFTPVREPGNAEAKGTFVFSPEKGRTPAGPEAAADAEQPQKSGVMSKTIEEEAAELGMDPRVVAFLDADMASDRLRILDSLRGMATNDMIDIMAMAAGIDIEEGEPWDRFAELRECLKTVERFETSRLR